MEAYQQKKIYIFMGPPGAGKGTLAQLCSQHMGWIRLSTGNLCRQHIEQKTEIGQQIDLAIKNGKLISDSLIVSMVEEWLLGQSGDATPLILDGFPRTKMQAEQLEIILQKPVFKHFSAAVISMIIDDESVVQRLAARLICKDKDCQAVYSTAHRDLAPDATLTCKLCSAPLTRREDDKEEVIRERLASYRSHTGDVLEYYQKHGYPVENLTVDRPMDHVYEQFITLVQSELS